MSKFKLSAFDIAIASTNRHCHEWNEAAHLLQLARAHNFPNLEKIRERYELATRTMIEDLSYSLKSLDISE